MANAERIEEIISDEALQQVETLNNKLTVAVNNFNKALEGSKKLDAALQGAKGLREIQKQVDALTENQKKLDAEQKAIIKSTNDLAKANARLAQSTSNEAIELAKTRAQQELTNKENKEAARAALGLIDAYKQMSNEHVKLRREAKNLGVELGINDDRFIAAADKANKYDQELKKIDNALGQYGRNVGNYASATMSVSQILRELPAFTYSVQTGLMGMSNNFPILIDQYKALSEQIDINTGKQLGSIKALKIMAVSMFSFTNVLTLGFSLLTMFGDKIFDSFKKSKKATDDARKSNEEYVSSLESVRSSHVKGTQEAQKELTTLKLLFDSYRNSNLPLKERRESYKKLQELYPEYFKNLNFEETASVKVKDAYNKLTTSILATARARAASDLITQKATEKLVNEEKINDLLREKENNLRQIAQLTAKAKAGEISYSDAISQQIPLQEKANKAHNEALALTQKNAALTNEQLRLEKKAQQEVLNGGTLTDPGKNGGKDAEDAAKKAEDLRKRELSARYDYNNIVLNGELAHYNAILENEKLSYNDRIDALNMYETIQSTILDNEYQKAMSTQQLTNQEKLNLASKYGVDLISLQNEIDKKQDEISDQHRALEEERLKKALDERLKIIGLSVAEEKERLTDQEQQALVALAEKYKAGVLTKIEYEKQKSEVQRGYVKARLQSELDAAQLIFDTLKAQGLDTTDAEKNLADTRRKISKELADDQIKDAERVAEEKQKLYEKEKELAGEIANTVTAFFDANIERKKNEIQAEKDAVDVRKQADIEKVNSSLDTEAEKADKIAVINARAQAQKEALERRQRQLDQQKARYDRAVAIGKIIYDTASAVVESLPNIPLSILVGAIGAAQLAQVIARPIPQYATGTDYSPEGLAIVGEKGPELRINPDGTHELTPGTASYAYLKEGTKIIPADITKNLINQSMLANAGSVQFKNEADFDRHTSRMIDAYRAETKELKKAISNRPENHVSLTEGGLRTSVRRSGGWINYSNNHLSN